MPIKKKTITGAELAEKLKNKNLISEENAEDWLNLIKEIRSEQKLPDIKWDQEKIFRKKFYAIH